VIHVGASGWQYRDWRGRFYPARIPQTKWLEHYASIFATVELNNSFYRLPSEAGFEAWRDRTPDGFVFAVKASRYITHVRRLREPAEPVELLWSRARRLGSKLGPVLFQLPPKFGVDIERLRSLLGALPDGMRAAFEFRDDSWMVKRVYDLLEDSGAAFVLADRPGSRPPDIVTGGWSYLRFHQGTPSSPGYPRKTLRRWADRIAGLRVSDAFVYFNNDQGGAAVRDAQTMIDLLVERGASVSRPAPDAKNA